MTSDDLFCGMTHADRRPSVWRLWISLLFACRIGFDPIGDGSVFAERCDTATFALPGASTITDDFSSGGFTNRWDPVSPCVDQIGGELVSMPPSNRGYCHAISL